VLRAILLYFRLHPSAFRLAKRRHRRQALGSGASQQLQQKRLHLVIEMVCQSNKVGLEPPYA